MVPNLIIDWDEKIRQRAQQRQSDCDSSTNDENVPSIWFPSKHPAPPTITWFEDVPSEFLSETNAITNFWPDQIWFGEKPSSCPCDFAQPTPGSGSRSGSPKSIYSTGDKEVHQVMPTSSAKLASSRPKQTRVSPAKVFFQSTDDSPKGAQSDTNKSGRISPLRNRMLPKITQTASGGWQTIRRHSPKAKNNRRGSQSKLQDDWLSDGSDGSSPAPCGEGAPSPMVRIPKPNKSDAFLSNPIIINRPHSHSKQGPGHIVTTANRDEHENTATSKSDNLTEASSSPDDELDDEEDEMSDELIEYGDESDHCLRQINPTTPRFPSLGMSSCALHTTAVASVTPATGERMGQRSRAHHDSSKSGKFNKPTTSVMNAKEKRRVSRLKRLKRTKKHNTDIPSTASNSPGRQSLTFRPIHKSAEKRFTQMTLEEMMKSEKK